MMSLKQLAAISVSIIGLSSASLALADMPYENKAGQSAQMTHDMQRQNESAASANGTWNKKSQTGNTSHRGNKFVESFRQSNTLGQSDAISKTRPYASLNKNYEPSPKPSLKADTSTYHDNKDRIGRRLDW
ncbi:hypothetical protein FGL86_00210 [Pistricoccus aurantiacus]|uniref:DUF4148 domain-containing protein n=1 Tax=Pistricoccus aurantiacus TaxID=1883414 RepID=A0A5B8SLL7_9GAMM|nr:hypothetical protein [Pistricoccus aurantiacus]QEA37646.1 hypothetical protein FGL86_00210 [Pistricoccus aurantiacus]